MFCSAGLGAFARGRTLAAFAIDPRRERFRCGGGLGADSQPRSLAGGSIQRSLENVPEDGGLRGARRRFRPGNGRGAGHLPDDAGQTSKARPLGMGQIMFTKYIVVVDDDVDVHTTSSLLKARPWITHGQWFG